MTTLKSEYFNSMGELTSSALGQFAAIPTGSLYGRPVGPRLAEHDAPGWSAMVKDTGNVEAYFDLTAAPGSSANPRGAMMGWYYFTRGTTDNFSRFLWMDRQGADAPIQHLAIGPTGIIQTGNGGWSTHTPITIDFNKWYFFMIAWFYTAAGHVYDYRFYNKEIGGELSEFHSYDNLGGNSAPGEGYVGTQSIAAVNNWAGRVGAARLATFAENDFSDIAYPADILEPVVERHTWYAGPNGLATNTGLAPGLGFERPLDVTHLNEEMAYGGFIPVSTGYANGDILVIDTSEEPFDLHVDSSAAISFNIACRGITVQPAEGADYFDVKSWHDSGDGILWVQNGTHAVIYEWDGDYGSESADANMVWEDDVNPSRMARPDHASDAAVLTAMAAKPEGEFWVWSATDGSKVYIKPSGNGDPNGNGKTYTISANIGGTGNPPVVVTALDVNIEGLRCLYTCLANTTTSAVTDGDPIDGTALSFGIGSGGTYRMANCWFDKWGKHAWKVVHSASDSAFTDFNNWPGDGSNYCPSGGQSQLAYYNGNAAATGNTITATYPVVTTNAMLAQSTGGTFNLAHASLIIHRDAAATPFSAISITGGQLPGLINEQIATDALTMTDFKFAGGATGATTTTISRCHLTNRPYYLQAASKTLTVINSVINAAVSFNAGNIETYCRGTIIYKAVSIDCAGATAGDAAAALFVRDAAVAFTFQGCYVNFAGKAIALIADAAAGEITADYNEYSSAVGVRHFENYDSSDRTGTAVIALGQEANSLFSSTSVIEAGNFRPKAPTLAVPLATITGLTSTTDRYGRKRPPSGNTTAGGVIVAQQGGMQGMIGSGLY
jgi:hypothetical protein